MLFIIVNLPSVKVRPEWFYAKYFLGNVGTYLKTDPCIPVVIQRMFRIDR